MSEVHNALAAVQSELDALKKTKTNPHFKSKYIPLEDIVEAIDPLLQKHGLVFYAVPTHIGPEIPALGYELRHLESGECVKEMMPLILDKQNSQGVGSAITYARRYILTSLFNIIADVDDDGNKASAPTKPKRNEIGLSTGPESFTDQVRATGKKAAEIREWASTMVNPKTGKNYTLDDVGVDAKDLTKFLNGLPEAYQKALLSWAS
jgi:hypothetical protein